MKTSNNICFVFYFRQVESLEEGAFYEFRIAASNLAGLGLYSDPSEHFKCDAWTSPEPGNAYLVHTSLAGMI